MTVTVIVLNFNGMASRCLPPCLESLRRQSYPSLQIIVVDNASPDDSASYVAGVPGVLLIRSEAPLGYGQANNLAYARATGDYVLFANHDTVFSPECIQQLVNAASLAPDVGMVAPKLLRPTPAGVPATLDSAGTLLRRDLTMVDRGFGVPDRGQFDVPADVFAPCGAAAFFPRRVLDAIRHQDGTLWDEDFGYYYEDGDLGWRARNAGWRCIYWPAAVAQHHRGLTMPPKFFDKTRRFQVETIKNRYLMIAKNAPARLLIVNLPFLLAREAFIWGYLLLHPGLSIAVLGALGPPLRRALQKRRGHSRAGNELGLFAGHPLPAEGNGPRGHARAASQT